MYWSGLRGRSQLWITNCETLVNALASPPGSLVERYHRMDGVSTEGEGAMGKATELDDFLDTQRLTPDEIRQRRTAEEISDPDIEVTSAGNLVKRPRPAAPPRVVQQRQTATWD